MRPDLSVGDGPDAAARRVAQRVGIGVSLAAFVLMLVLFASAGSVLSWGAGVWVGVVGGGVGGAIYLFYKRGGAERSLAWADFADREGRPGWLPIN